LFNKYHKYKKLVLINTICFWHFSSFILISGYVGYNSIKISNLLYLWLYVLFYSLGITYCYRKYISNTNEEKITFEDYFPVHFEKYWYFTKYFGMYCFLPLINKGIASLTKSELRNIVICLILVYVLLKDAINPKIDIYAMKNGYSVLWFQIYYITGAYFGKYNNEFNGTKKIAFFIIYLFAFYYSTDLCFKISNSLNNSKEDFKAKIMIILKRLFVLRISSFPMILQSISIILLFPQIKYNEYFAKIIAFLGPFTFGIYLIHTDPIFKNNIIKQLFQKESNYLSFSTVVKLILIRSFEIFGFCLIIDYFRNILFIFLRIRKICIIVERIIYKLI
jgi:surface polysaccharide O-acyltransferase-like enzyme